MNIKSILETQFKKMKSLVVSIFSLAGSLGLFAQTNAIQPKVESATTNGWTVFPVPAGPVLNIQYKGNEPLTGVVNITLQSLASGIYFIRLRLASTTRSIQIPITHIGRGIYDLRIAVQDKVLWSQRIVK